MRVILGITLLGLIAGTIILGVTFGDVQIHFSQAFSCIFAPDGSIESEIVWEYRLPRVLVGALVGANLAVSGALFQAVTRNPLAAPNVIGITAGAGMFAVITMIVIPDLPPAALPFAAFAGAILAGMIVYSIAWKKGISPGRLALSGIALDSLFQAITTGVLVKFPLEAGAAIIWLAGSLWGRGWEQVQSIWPWSLVCLFIAWLFGKRLNVMVLSEEVAISLGVQMERNRLFILFIAILLAGSAVAVAGPVGFIGLVIPHLTRLIVGPSYQLIIPVSACLGALLVMIADIIGRTVIAPIEIPVGVFTALIGAPYFVYLLRKKRI